MEKYSNLGGYVYCNNNPIRFIDPDGKKIVDANGSVIYKKDDNGWHWTDNATEDAKIIASAMMLSPKGREDFLNMAQTEIPMELVFNRTVEGQSIGENKIEKGLDLKIIKSKITIYEKNIDRHLNMDEVRRNAKKPYGGLHAAVFNRMKDNKFSKLELIAAVASHEFGHKDHPLANTSFHNDVLMMEDIADSYQHKAINSILENRMTKIESIKLENEKVSDKYHKIIIND